MLDDHGGEFGAPAASCPGMRLSPSTLTAKIRISVISGTRIRRSTRKIGAEAWTPDPARAASRPRPVPGALVTAVRRYERRNELVSTTSSTSETMLAISAPPDSETMLAVAPAVRPSLATCAAKAQKIVAAISCRSATRLVALPLPLVTRGPGRSTRVAGRAKRQQRPTSSVGPA